MKRSLFALAAVFVSVHAFAWGNSAAPGWVKTLAASPQMKVDEKADGVVLLDETITTVRDDGEVRSLHRRAYRILRNGGRDLATEYVSYDNDTRISGFHAWSINAAGQEFDASDRDAVETGAGEELYADQKTRMLQVAGDIGSVVAFEYERREHPFTLQVMWQPQRAIPVQRARLTVVLPDGWSHEERWFNTANAIAPTVAGNQTTWEVSELPAITDEPRMPAWRAVSTRLGVNFIPRDARVKGKSHRTWDDVATMFTGLAAPAATSSPEIAAKTKELVAGHEGYLDKIAAIAAFAQRDVRYVAIEIGRGGIQPHPAAAIYSHRYGDCKDKVTLMTAMLHEIGVSPYFVLANTVRGEVDRDFASAAVFNHAIIAIPIPANVDTKSMSGVVDVPRFGKLLLFDPTSEVTPFGILPPYLQENRVLIASADRGELVDVAAHPPETSRITRNAKLALGEDGTLSGEILETTAGASAASRRYALKAKNPAERKSYYESMLAWHLAQFSVQDITFENVDDLTKDLVVHYKVTAPSYAKKSGALWLVRPRIVGSKAETVLDLKERKYGYESDGPSLDVDEIDIALPPTLDLEELPPPMKAAGASIRYTSESKLDAGHLRYHREYRVEKISLPRDQLAELNKVFSQILSDERASVVLKRK